MKNAFIFHGTGGFPEENWFPWLKNELEQLDYEVHVPQFPTPDNQTLEAWFNVFKEYESSLSEQTIMIGHSLGGAFLLRVLEKMHQKIMIAGIIAAPIGIPPIRNMEGDHPFIGHPFNWNAIQEHAKHFIIFHSDTDPYVSLKNGQMTAEKLHTQLNFIPNAGHFNKAAGYTQFAELHEKIKEALFKS